MKKKYLLILPLWLPVLIFAQNTGIGTSTPTKGKLEVVGVAGAGATSAAFGTDGTGISFQRDWPTIGFNQYRNSILPGSEGKYMNNGCASIITMDPSSGSLLFQMFPSGTANSATPGGNRAITILNNGNIGFQGNADDSIGLLVNRLPTNTYGTAVFNGTNYNSHFFWDANEDTYIRGGKNGSKIIFNDITNGSIVVNGRNAYGNIPNGTSYVPLIYNEFWGAISFSRSYSINVQQSEWISDPSSSSNVKVFNTSTNFAIELNIANGNVDGQILIIEGNQNPFTIRAGGAKNVFGSDMVIGGGDILTLIWNAQRGKWMRFSYSNN